MSRRQALETQRQLASAASRGISSDVIYSRFKEVVTELKLKGDMLDFGAGAGSLTRYLHALGCFRSITAIDIMRRPPDLAEDIQWITCDLNEQTSIADQSFDAIVASEVIEHLENPRATVREWFRLLRPGGTLVLSTPNNESWRSVLSLIIRGHFVEFGDTSYPAHITALLRKDIERILTEAGFPAPRVVFTDVGGIPKLPRVRWQTVSAGLLRGLRYSDNFLAVTRKPE